MTRTIMFMLRVSQKVTFKEIVLSNLNLSFNLDFNIPQSQFPIKILPQDSVLLDICFTPLKHEYGELYDTLYIREECFQRDILLRGELLHSVFSSQSNCNMEIIGKTYSNNKINKNIPQITFQAHSSGNEISIKYENSENSGVISLFNILGESVFSGKINNKFGEVIFSTENFSKGIYILKISNQYTYVIQKIQILR